MSIHSIINKIWKYYITFLIYFSWYSVKFHCYIYKVTIQKYENGEN